MDFTGRRIFILLIFGFVCNQATSQSEWFDSVRVVANNHLEDTMRVKAMHSLAWKFKNSNTDSATYYGLEGLALATKIQYNKGVADVANGLGVTYRIRGDYPLSLQYFSQAEAMYAAIGSKYGLASCLSNIGVTYRRKGDYNMAIEKYNAALSINKEIGNERNAARNLTNIGLAYSSKGMPDKALEYYTEALPIAQNLDDQSNIANTLTNMAIVYKAKGHFEKAMNHFQEAGEMFKEMNNPRSLATIYNNMALVFRASEDYDNAVDLHKKALQLRRQIGHKSGLFSSNLNIANLYMELHQIDSAKLYAIQALEISKELGNKHRIALATMGAGRIYHHDKAYEQARQYYHDALNSFNNIGDKQNSIEAQMNLANLAADQQDTQGAVNILETTLTLADSINFLDGSRRIAYNLHEYHNQLGNYETSLFYYKKYDEAQDSIFSGDMEYKLNELKVQHELEKKEIALLNLSATNNQLSNENEVLEESRLRERFLRIIFSIGFILLSIIGALIFSNFRIKRKKEITEKELSASKLANAKLKEKQMNEQLEFQSKQLTTKTLHLIQKNELMDNLKKRITEINGGDRIRTAELNKVVNLVNYSLNLDKNWDEFKLHFEQTNKDFFPSLKAMHPDLTTNQLRLCAMIRLNLNIKEAATIMNLSPNSVRIARTRLRKKLGLGKEENLEDFLLNVGKDRDISVDL